MRWEKIHIQFMEVSEKHVSVFVPFHDLKKGKDINKFQK